MSVLIVIDQAPYGNWSGRESLDMAFALAAFDQPVSLLFRGAGVNWLRARQDGATLQQKTVERNLSAAPVFGVEALMADAASLGRYRLDPDGMLAGVTVVDAAAELYRQFQHVVSL